MKRLRVNLSSRFVSELGDPTAACSTALSPPGGKPLQDNQHALLSLRRVRGHKGVSPRLLQSNMEEHCLTGDFCKPLVLPVERVDHQNLHCISADTVAALLRGQYRDTVEDFLIVDCRYPYEYQGGHIKGAVNLHTKAQIQGALMQVPVLVQLSSSGRTPAGPPGGDQDPGGLAGAVWREGGQTGSMTSPQPGSPMTEGSSPRKLIVFHCEFSTERGPRLCGYLRELDRVLHSSVYPLLFYPEVYLLDQGYKHFYCCHTDLCEPRGYVPMRHRDYREQLCRSRNRARSRLRKSARHSAN
ncbi:cell division cycle 25 homolog d [Osmerus mordax]|uniref:cell division cycle 25 homolog d n=1 Tax=Osmerus mordax TaxID=8014 RepID=UPI00350FD2A0